MSVFFSMRTFLSKKIVSTPNTPSRYLFVSPRSAFADEKPVEVNDTLEDLRAPELTEEEILQKRFKSRLPERVYRRFVLKEALPIETKYDFLRRRLRAYYGRNGEASGLNPGICWPTRDELEELLEYNRKYEPSLQERLERKRAEISASEEEKRQREAEVDKNMANLEKWMGEYHAKQRKIEERASEMRLKREQLVEEISEYLGYDIDPRDPRFKEAVEQREKEKKKAQKVKKQQESYNKMLNKLKEIAQQK